MWVTECSKGICTCQINDYTLTQSVRIITHKYIKRIRVTVLLAYNGVTDIFLAWFLYKKKESKIYHRAWQILHKLLVCSVANSKSSYFVICVGKARFTNHAGEYLGRSEFFFPDRK